MLYQASVPGVVAWRVATGAVVNSGDVLGEIVNIEDPDAPRVAVTSNTSGFVFGMRTHKLVRPGQIIIKVAGEAPLSWRTGNLLTAK
jgi:predicted deacylase